ncbi:MAG: hypothetical protein methR_P3386 [Methyloprofundus sp.]|nr:MAG: hypothetical protein methR_P3386 [Methyloprofundus sp.]
MPHLKYLSGYSSTVQEQVQSLINSGKLTDVLISKYPEMHQVRSDKALYHYTLDIKNQFMRKSNALNKVIYDDKLDVLHHALGLHAVVSRVQGSKLKAKNEIRIGSVFKKMPVEFLRMIVVHELAHLREKQHNKAFYQLCLHMEPEYHQLEFDVRLYLTQLDLP